MDQERRGDMKAQKSQAKAKALKTRAVKKAPEAVESHAAIEDWMQRVMPALHPIVKRLDELICKTIPGLQYAIKWKQAYYGLPQQGWIIEMVAYDVSVNVVFLGGADFDPPPPLGTRGRSRYVKLKTVEEAESHLMHKWIEEAGRVPGWKRGPG
jgi:hypothetical protein